MLALKSLPKKSTNKSLLSEFDTLCKMISSVEAEKDESVISRNFLDIILQLKKCETLAREKNCQRMFLLMKETLKQDYSHYQKDDYCIIKNIDNDVEDALEHYMDENIIHKKTGAFLSSVPFKSLTMSEILSQLSA